MLIKPFEYIILNQKNALQEKKGLFLLRPLLTLTMMEYWTLLLATLILMQNIENNHPKEMLLKKPRIHTSLLYIMETQRVNLNKLTYLSQQE